MQVEIEQTVNAEGQKPRECAGHDRALEALRFRARGAKARQQRKAREARDQECAERSSFRDGFQEVALGVLDIELASSGAESAKRVGVGTEARTHEWTGADQPACIAP